MIALTGREFEDRGDVGRFEIRVVAQDFFARRARGEQVEHVFHADAESADARAATADVRTHRDSFDGAHVPCLQAIDSIILARWRRTAIAICTIWPPAIDSLTGDDRTIADFIGWEQPASVLAFVRGLADEHHFLARDCVRRVADRGRLAPILKRRASLGPTAFVFGSPAGEYVESFKTAWESLLLVANGHDSKRAKPGARVDREKLRQIDLHWHDLRHEGACRLLADGVDIRNIQLVLGHSDVRITQRYLNITDEELRRAVTGVWERRRQLRAVAGQ